MWFRIRLNAFLPTVSVLIGNGGILYFKLTDIGNLLRKKNPYVYRTTYKTLAVISRDILPLEGYTIPPKTLSHYVVPLRTAYRLLVAENPEVGHLFWKCWLDGIAIKHGMRKFVTHEPKSPLLECVEEQTDKCVSIPLWVDNFIKDLELYREEVKKSLIPCKRKSENFPVVKRLLTSFPSTSTDTNIPIQVGEDISRESQPVRVENEIPRESQPVRVDSEDEIPRESQPVRVDSEDEIPRESQPMQVENDISGESVPVRVENDISGESVPVRVENDISRESQPVRVNLEPSENSTLVVSQSSNSPVQIDSEHEIPRELEPSESEPIQVKLEPSNSQQSNPSEVEPETSPMEPIVVDAERPVENSNYTTYRAPSCLVNISQIPFENTMGKFPEPGDLIVKFHRPPPRVFFILGESDAMYWTVDKRE